MEAKISIKEVREMIKFFEEDKKEDAKSRTMKGLDDWLYSKEIEHKLKQERKKSYY